VLNKSIASKNSSDPIGIFDSGVGGLSIAKCITDTLPNEQLIYVADSACAPYGDISVTQIQLRVNTITAWLINQNVKAVVIACNTATVNAIEQLRKQCSIPIIGVEPAIKPAAELSKKNKVAILVTQATAKHQRFLALIAKHKKTSQVIVQACPGLVELVEAGKIDSSDCRRLLKKYLLPLMDQGIDTLVLGCTHYPFLRHQISQITGHNMTIMETAKPVTEQLKRRLAHHDLLASCSLPTHRFLSTKNCATQQQIFNDLWNQKIDIETLI
jgi:glutamate racemase